MALIARDRRATYLLVFALIPCVLADADNVESITIAHAVLGSLAWIIFFPCGAYVMQFMHGPNTWKIHASFQAFSLCLLTAAAGMGIKVASDTQQVSEYHSVIGYVLFALAWGAAVGGALAHTLYKKKQRQTVVAIAHLWLGRTLITLGMIQGGLGLLLADDATRGEYIAYGVIAGVSWLIFVAMSVWRDVSRSRKAQPQPSGESKMERDLSP